MAQCSKHTGNMDCVRNYVNLSLSTVYLIFLVFISKEVIGSCPLGYLDIVQTSKYCYKNPFLHNQLTNNEIHAVDGKTWKEAEILCNKTPGAKLAAFHTLGEFEIFIKSFQEFYVIRNMYRDNTEASGVYFPSIRHYVLNHLLDVPCGILV